MPSGIPNIIYGTAWKKERTEALVRLALAQGFRGVDTACQPKHYNEAGVGAAVAACLSPQLSRDSLFLQTKFTPLSGQDPKRVPYDSQASLAEQVAQSFAMSQRNLQTSYVDALLLHSPLATREQTLEVWRAMEALVDAGGARRIGISNNYQLRELEALCRSARVQPSVLQNRFYAQSGYDVDIRAFCREHDIVYQSFWTLSANPHILADETVRLLGLKYRRTPAQILFRYLTLEGVVPLTGTQSETHMRESLGIFDFELTPSERLGLSALLDESA